MEVDSTGEQEARLIALEHQVHALTAGQQQLDQKLDDSVARTESQYQTLHTQVNQQMESHGHQMQGSVLLSDATDRSVAFEETSDGMTVPPRPCAQQGWWPPSILLLWLVPPWNLSVRPLPWTLCSSFAWLLPPFLCSCRSRWNSPCLAPVHNRCSGPGVCLLDFR